MTDDMKLQQCRLGKHKWSAWNISRFMWRRQCHVCTAPDYRDLKHGG